MASTYTTSKNTNDCSQNNCNQLYDTALSYPRAIRVRNRFAETRTRKGVSNTFVSRGGQTAAGTRARKWAENYLLERRMFRWRWRPVSAKQAAGTHCAPTESSVGTATQRVSRKRRGDRCGLVHRLGSPVRGEIAANTAPRAIHDRTCFAQGERDTESCAASGAGDDGGVATGHIRRRELAVFFWRAMLVLPDGTRPRLW